jgi:hypothetical protein
MDQLYLACLRGRDAMRNLLLTAQAAGSARARRLARHLAVVLVGALLALPAGPALAGSTFSVAGSFLEKLGCYNWDPTCAAAALTFDAEDQVWQGAFTLPAGSYQYEVVADGTFWEVWGLHGPFDISDLDLGADGTVKFYYDDQTHWVADSVNSTIAVLAGDFQDELGCASDWTPGCLRSWLEDADGDGIYSFSTNLLPPGDYVAKVTLDESFDLNYGAGGQVNGDLISFTVGAAPVQFAWNRSTHVLQVDTVGGGPDTGGGGVPEPSAWILMIAGFGLAGAALRRGYRNSSAQASTMASTSRP